jgi:hypothetical protein
MVIGSNNSELKFVISWNCEHVAVIIIIGSSSSSSSSVGSICSILLCVRNY